MVMIQQWVAVWDQSLCERCEGLHGAWLVEGEGPLPRVDTHPGCRCRRVPVARTEELDPGQRIVYGLRVSGSRDQVRHAMTLPTTRSRAERDAAAAERRARLAQERRNTRGPEGAGR